MSTETDSFVDSIPFLTFQQRRILKENAADLDLWRGPCIQELWPDVEIKNKKEAGYWYSKVIGKADSLRAAGPDYSSFDPGISEPVHSHIITDFKAPSTIMGRCPCPSESPVLRCCNLKTLDAIQQCAFGCSYCSIQSFYSQSCIRVVSDLDNVLSEMKVDNSLWHIGTGQSSDSLLLGDDYGTLTSLSHFAEKHPQLFIELKTKSSRTDWLSLNLPLNIVATWSVNSPVIAEKEEHFTASVRNRIKAAAECASKGRPVGFHIHPMVWYKGWQEGYRSLVEMLTDSIDPSYVVMTGIGTLTFTKQNLKTLRNAGRPTLTTCIPFEEIGGKYSYPLQIKKDMFSYLYSLFPQSWKDSVFFYLCMENKNLWKPCLGREYASNSEFEMDMKSHYMKKINFFKEELAKLSLEKMNLNF